MTAATRSSLTLRSSRTISSADYDPVCRCVCVVFRLLGDDGVVLLHARFSFASTGMLGFLSEPIDSWHASKCCSAHASTLPLIGLIWPKAGYASIA
jgi:hypothetical protein